MEVMAARDWREGVVKKDLSFWRKVVMLLVKPSTAKSHVNALRFFHLDHSLLTTIFTDPVFPGSFNGASRDTVRVSSEYVSSLNYTFLNPSSPNSAPPSHATLWHSKCYQPRSYSLSLSTFVEWPVETYKRIRAFGATCDSGNENDDLSIS